MASPTDQSQGARALPRPELNPLVNPLLADNMGRWAEVYFTSPPEKREEAVLELLRELEAQNSAREVGSVSQQSALATRSEMSAPAYESPAEIDPSDLQRCDSCGHPNPSRHQFCGMCGAQMGRAVSQSFRMGTSDHSQGGGYQHAEVPTESSAQPREEHLSIAEDSSRDLYDLSPFQTLRETEYAANAEYGQSPIARYRYYIGVGLAVLILALGYMGWRASQQGENAHDAPLPAAATTETAPPSASPSPAATAPSSTSKPPDPQPVRANMAQPTPPQSAASRKQPDFAAPASTPTLGQQPAATNAEGQGLQGYGAEEFTMAQRLLSGTNGQRRDSAEAAKWLWKSIAKHNGPAVLALADLYLKGDGVSKNCDQARVLLDSAALRGTAGAGERLRNLQAFGCQ